MVMRSSREFRKDNSPLIPKSVTSFTRLIMPCFSGLPSRAISAKISSASTFVKVESKSMIKCFVSSNGIGLKFFDTMLTLQIVFFTTIKLFSI